MKGGANSGTQIRRGTTKPHLTRIKEDKLQLPCTPALSLLHLLVCYVTTEGAEAIVNFVQREALGAAFFCLKIPLLAYRLCQFYEKREIRNKLVFV